MALDLSRWREWVTQEKRLFADLALILATALVIGVFFLENIGSALEQSRRQGVDSLAQQLSRNAREYVVTNNRISLNVMASHAAELALLQRVEIHSAAHDVLASAGEDAPAGPAAERAIRLDDQSVAGYVLVWSAPDTATADRLESGFVIIALALLLLRVLVAVVQRRVAAVEAVIEDEEDTLEADILPVLTMGSTGSGSRAWLRVSIVNFERMQSRLTATLMDEILTGYRQRLEQVASVYGATLLAPLGEEAALEFTGQTRTEACFQALCAGMLFRRLSRELSDARKNADRTPLEFKQLVTGMGNLETSWSICEAGLPGRVHVPEQELVSLELDTRLLFQPERCLVIEAGEHSVRVQPVEQLAQRYQRLVAEQARRLADAA